MMKDFLRQVCNLELIDEDGTTATLSDVETVLNNIGVQLRSSTNEFRDFDDVLDDTAKRWDKLSSVQQAAVSKAFAGQRQANRFKLLMENYDTALEYEKIANKSSGTAIQKFNDAYLNSIEAKQKSLQASFESLSVNLFNRDSISGILEATQALVEFLDKTNLLKGVLSGLAVGGALKGFVALTTSITQAAMKMQNFQQAMSLLKIGDISTDGIEKLSVLMDGLSRSQLKAVISSEQLSTAQRLSILTAMGMSDAQASATLSTMGLSTAEGAATASTLSLGSAFKGLWSTLMANPIVLISTVLTAGIAMWSSYKQSIEESIQKATDASTAWRESTNTLNEQITKYKELKAQLDSGTLTPAEEFETRQQILDIQTQITSEYGNQVSGIDLVNGSLRTQLGLLQQISSENARSTLNENRKEYKEAFDEMTKEQAYNLGSIEIDDKSEVNKDIRNIVDSFEDAGLSLTKSGGGGALLSVLFKGDATQAEATIDSFMNKIDTLKTKYNDKNSIHVLDSILDQVSVSLSDNKKILEDYQENYKTFLQMDMLSKGSDKGSVADIFNKYTESVQKYNEALSSENKDHINKARTDFSSLSEEVNNLLSKGDNSKFSTLFDDVTDQLNKASIKAFDFQEALSGEAGSKNQFHKVSEDIKSVSDHLKELKLDSIDALDALLTEGNQVGESELWTLAEAWGLRAESSKDDLQSFIDILSQVEIVSGEVANSMENASQSFDAYSTSVQKAQENLATLKDILSESVSGAGISADHVEAFRDIFGEDADKALEKTANGYHLNKQAVAGLKSQLDEMTKSDYLSALSDQYTELQNIEGKIAAAEILGQDTSGLEASRNGILDNITSLQDLQFQYEAATSAYQQWQAAMSGGEEGDMYDSIYGNLENAGELYDKGLTGTNAFREFTDLMSNKDLSTASNEEIVKAYESAIPVIKKYFTEGQKGAQNFLTDIQNINSEWAHMNEDGSWDINFGVGQDQDIADALNMDVEAVQAVMRKLSDYGFEINLDEPIASLEELKLQAESANEILSGLGDDLKIDLNTDSFEGVDKQISSLKEYIGEVEASDLELDVKTDRLDAANSILEYLVARKQEIGKSEDVDITVNINEAELQSGYATLNQLKADLANIQGKVGIDTTGVQTDINNCVAQIEAMSPEMKVALGIHGMSIDQIKSGLMDGSIEVPVNADTKQANSNINEVKKNDIKDKNFTVTANASQAIGALASVRSYLSGITSKTVTVTVNKVTNETTNKSSGTSGKTGTSSKSTKSDKSGTKGHFVNGTAHIRGTAFANGNWGNPVAHKALVGELGAEIIVDPHTGHWYTVGDNGAEFVEVPKNAIVFNHLQSESLLKNGYAAGRGQALVSGTALSNGTGKFNFSNSGSKASSVKTKKKSTSSTTTPSTNTAESISDTNEKAEEFEETLDAIEILINRIERQIKNLERVAGSAFNTFEKRNNALREQMSSITQEISAQQQGYERYLQKANSVELSEDYKNLVRNGAIDISTITDEELSKNIQEFQEWYEKALDCRDAIEELKESVRELYTEAFENVVTLYDGMLNQIDHRRNMLEGYIDQTEAQGYIVSTKYYDALISNEQNKLNKLTKERNDLINAMNDAIVNGGIEMYSEQWYEFQEDINSVNEAIQDANTSIIKFKNSIREIKWDIFDKVQDRISAITDEADFLVKVMSDEDMYDDKGVVTKHGTATYGLHGVNYNVFMSQADQYKKEMKAIEKELSKDPYNQTLIERRKELLELQQESILAAEDEKQAIKNLVEEGIQKQLDALKELIDKYNEALNSQKDMYDYQKDIDKKQKTVDSLEKQWLAYQGDDSEEGSVNRQQTWNDFEEARAELEETQYEKYISDQKKLLDELYTEYETVLNMRLDNLDQLIASVIEGVNAEGSNIRDTLISESEKVGYTLTNSMETIWGSNGPIANILTTYSGNFSSIMTSVQAAINDIKIAIQNAVSASNKNASENISKINKDQTQQTTKPTTVQKPATKPTTTKPATNNTGGDGVPRVGDRVTYTKDRYYYSSDGLNPSGNQMLGQSVYITSINNASWAKKPYHISRGSTLGNGDLGWVSLDQLKGYRTGTPLIDKNQLAWTQEVGGELVLGRSDGAILTPLKRGDAVVNKEGTDQVVEFAKNPKAFIGKSLSELTQEMPITRNDGVGTTVQNEFSVNFAIDKVVDYNDIVTKMQHDHNIERFIQSVGFGQMMGKGTLNKYNIRFGK